MQYIFLKESFHNNFLAKPNLGNPDILKTNFVLNLNSINSVNGSDVIKCIIRKSGFFLAIKFNKGKNDKI